MPLEARPVSTVGPEIRVSNAAARVPGATSTVSNQPRRHGPSVSSSKTRSLPGLAAAVRADSREDVVAMACTCVGPPTTSRSASATNARVTSCTETMVTSRAGRRPSAIRSATVWVLPYMDSYTIRARITASLRGRLRMCGPMVP